MNTDQNQEQEARAYRDAIYGPCSENNWEACKVAWLKDFEWLKSVSPHCAHCVGARHPTSS